MAVNKYLSWLVYVYGFSVSRISINICDITLTVTIGRHPQPPTFSPTPLPPFYPIVVCQGVGGWERNGGGGVGWTVATVDYGTLPTPPTPPRPTCAVPLTPTPCPGLLVRCRTC